MHRVEGYDITYSVCATVRYRAGQADCIQPPCRAAGLLACAVGDYEHVEQILLLIVSKQ